jgi:hypothetical protein
VRVNILKRREYGRRLQAIVDLVFGALDLDFGAGGLDFGALDLDF